MRRMTSVWLAYLSQHVHNLIENTCRFSNHQAAVKMSMMQQQQKQRKNIANNRPIDYAHHKHWWKPLKNGWCFIA